MNVPLHVLFVEDSEDDMLLQVRELRHGGYEPRWERVEAPERLQAALARPDWDIVISDYALPRFNGLDALRLVQESGLDLPFILISGTIGEDVAVDCMKAGAHDYLLKDSLVRLVPAVQRELRDAAERRQRRQAERALRESHQLLSLICEHTAEMLVLFRSDPAGAYRVASVNRGWLDFCRRLGRSVDEAACLGRTTDEVLALLSTADEVSTLLRGHFALADARACPAPFELEWPAAGGALLTEQQLIAFSNGGGSRMLLWTSRDVTTRKQAEDQQWRLEAQLQQAQKMETLGTLAGGIAHDFNNILTGLSGHLDLIRPDVEPLPAVRESVEQLQAGILRAAALVRRILDFSRKRTSLRKPIRLGPVVHEAMKFLRPLVPAGVVVHEQIQAQEPLVAADAGQVHQVVANLCSNAFHALQPDGGLLQVTLEAVAVDDARAAQHPPLQPGPHVRLRIRDTGCGMDEATLARLFEPFFTTRPPGAGTGLGLVVVKGIVSAHEGAVGVTSRPGQGTTFDLYFPAAEATGSDVHPGLPSRGEEVMFVDDEAYITHMATALLRRLGCQVRAFTDPIEALRAFTAEPARFAVLITDLAMPRLRGTDLARQMRLLRPDLPVLLTTGFCDAPELERARQQGFPLVLEKPFTVDRLVELLREVLRPTVG
jgi:signal transduction histidine kinase/FixJ family two-component response regulator